MNEHLERLVREAVDGLDLGVDVDVLRRRIEEEALASYDAFKLCQEVAAVLLKKRPDVAQDLMRCGVVVRVGIADVENVGVLVDLKNGTEPRIDANDTIDEQGAVDVHVQYASENQFRATMAQKVDLQRAVSLGQIKLEASLRSKMKLMPLLDLGKRLERELQEKANKEAMASINWEDAPVSGVFQGTLEKKSEWLKSWNPRYFQLEWEPFHRPSLSYSLASGLEPKKTIELSSSIAVEARVTTRRDKVNQSAFALVDRKTDSDIMVLCAETAEKRAEWLKNLKAAITARARAHHQRSLVSLRKQNDTEEDQEELRPVRNDIMDEAEANFIASGMESHLHFILRRISWFAIPLLFLATQVTRSFISVVSGLIPTSFGGQIAILVIISVAWRMVNENPSFDLLRRRVTVLWLAARVIFDLKITEMKVEGLPPIHKEAMWTVKHRTVSEQIYSSTLSLGGLWIKVGQHIGARSDVMSRNIVKVLKRLQDEVPPTPFPVLKPFLEKELAKKLEDVFETFQEEPIAAASIGQVHIATLKSDSPESSQVVVKVQHPRVDQLLRQDVDSMGIISRWVTFIQPQMNDLVTQILDHWRENVLNELDFSREVKNMCEVGSNLKESEVYASVPSCVSSLCSKKVIVMKHVKGVKVNSFEDLRSIGIIGYNSRGKLAQDICDSFAHQIFIGGLCNADAHAGNVLVSKREDVADDQIMKLPSSVKHENDLEANRPVPVLLDFGLCLRLDDKLRLGMARLVYAASQLDAGGLYYGGSLVGIVLSRENILGDFGGLQHMLRDTAPPEESIRQTSRRIKLEKKKWEEEEFDIPVEAFPPQIVLIVRSLDLVRALCTSLEVRQPFIKTMATFAKKALLQRHPEPSPRSILLKSVRSGSLEEKLRKVLSERLGEFQGIQVSFISRSESFDIAHGRLSDIDRRNVEKDTLFPVSALAQTLAQIFIHKLLSNSSKSSLSAKMIEAVLSGDLRSIPFDCSALPEDFDTKTSRDWTSNFKFALKEAREPASLGKSILPHEFAHVAFLWGWLVAALAEDEALLEQLGKRSIKTRRTFFGQKKGKVEFQEVEQKPRLVEVAEEFGVFFGFPSEEAAEEMFRSGKVASLSFPVQKLLNQYGIDDVGSMGEVESFQNAPAANGGQPGLNMISDIVPSLKGKEAFVDPRMVNFPRVLSACLPAFNACTNSKTLAKLVHAVANQGEVSGKTVLDHTCSSAVLCSIRSKEATATDGPMRGSNLGLRSFDFSFKKESRKRCTAIGQIAFGGNSALSFPELREPFTVAILTNTLSLDSALTQALLDCVYDHYNLSAEGDY